MIAALIQVGAILKKWEKNLPTTEHIKVDSTLSPQKK